MAIEITGLNDALSHIVVQNVHNAARLNALLNAVAYLLAKQDGTEPEEEMKMLSERVNAAIPDLLAAAMDAINEVPDLGQDKPQA